MINFDRAFIRGNTLHMVGNMFGNYVEFTRPLHTTAWVQVAEDTRMFCEPMCDLESEWLEEVFIKNKPPGLNTL